METPMSASFPAPDRLPLDPEVLRFVRAEAEGHPEWADVQNRWGLALLATGKRARAERRFSHCLELNPRYGWAALNLAQCLALRGEHARALKIWEQGSEPAPGAKRAVRAFLAWRAGTPGEDERIVDALSDTVRRPDRLLLAAARMEARDPGHARRLRTEAGRDPRFAGADLAGWRGEENGRTNPLSLVFGLSDLWREAAVILEHLGRSDEAEASAVRAYLHWSDPGALLTLQGFLASLRGEDDAAARLYHEACETDPGNPRPFISLAYHWSAAGDLDAAHRALTEALERAPRYADLHFQMGLLERALGRHENALRAFRTAIDINPRYRLARLDMAVSLDRLQRWEEAAAMYRDVLGEGVRSSDIWLHLGRAEERRGLPAAAESAYREALKLNPGEALAHYRLGKLYRRTGRRAEAKRAWSRYLTLCRDPQRAAEVEALLEDEESPASKRGSES